MPPAPPPTTLCALKNRRGERLDNALHEAAAPRRGLVVLLHGVTSQKDRPWSYALAEGLAARGFAALRFSFSGNGASEGAFERSTPTAEVEELGSVLDIVGRELGVARVGVVGHSMGAAVACLRAARDRRIHALVCLAALVELERFFERHFAALEFGAPMLGKAACPWNRALWDDARALGSTLAHAGSIEAQSLWLHGDADELVPSAPALEFARRMPNAAEFVEIQHADHRFSAHGEIVTERVLDWLERRAPLG